MKLRPVGHTTWLAFLLLQLALCALVLATNSARAAVHYVDANNGRPAPPFNNWATVATTIQDAVDAAEPGDEIVVTNGVYATGERAVDGAMANRVAVDKPIALRSVNGPQVTIINGYQVPGTTNGDGAIRCVYLTNGASLSGFTLTQGATRSAGDYGTEQSGGGVWCTSTSNNATLSNCTLTGNSAASYGGGASWATLNNCTLTGNSAGVNGGGAYGDALNRGVLNNCIVYFNRAPNGANYWESAFTYSCTTPLPPGPGNIDADPQLASNTHLSPLSPCIGAGSPAYATGVDIDAEAWATPPSIGCDEYHAGAVTGPLSVGLVAAFTNVAAGFPVELTALIEGRTTARVWEFGDGLVASNQPYATHAWAAPGDYAVILRAYNESHAEGVSATVTVHVAAQPVHYVAADAANPLPPYTSWATAAWNIQDAVDVASTAGALVLVTNGIYTAGGRAAGTNVLINRVAVDKPTKRGQTITLFVVIISFAYNWILPVGWHAATAATARSHSGWCPNAGAPQSFLSSASSPSSAVRQSPVSPGRSCADAPVLPPATPIAPIPPQRSARPCSPPFPNADPRSDSHQAFPP